MSRVQLALNVNDIDEAVAFYATLFGTEPAKRRPGYANFAIAEPPLKLVLLENPGQGGSLNHLGVEVADTTAVDAEHGRARRGRARAGGRAGHHLLLRPAGQVLGAGGAGRRAVGDLHGPRRQPDLLGGGRRAELEAAEGALGAAPRAASAAALGAGQVSQCCGAAQEAGGREAGGPAPAAPDRAGAGPAWTWTRPPHPGLTVRQRVRQLLSELDATA